MKPALLYSPKGTLSDIWVRVQLAHSPTFRIPSTRAVLYPLAIPTHAQSPGMEGPENDDGKKESPPLQIDPKWYA